VTHVQKNLLNLTAYDVMSKDVEMIPQQMSLNTAARILSQACISGAPVVDSEGRCVGIISSTDFVRWASRSPNEVRRANQAGRRCMPWDLVDLEELPAEAVSSVMTKDPVVVPPSTPFAEMARKMVDAHIHRLVVVDREGKPIGIVTTTDMLAAVARLAAARPDKKSEPHAHSTANR
jgi:CBS-domain-containing membrane protein